MCENGDTLVKIVSITYLVLTFLVPVIYFLIYRFKPFKVDESGKQIPKDYAKHFMISLVIMVVFILFKIMFSLDIGVFNKLDCYINCNCEVINCKDEDKVMTSKKTSSTTTATTTSTTTTTTTTQRIEKTYEKVDEIEGERIDKGKTSKGFDIYEINGVTYIDGYLIANKSYFLPEDFVPTNTYKTADGSSTKQCSTCIDKAAYKAYQDMDADAAAINLNLWIQSGFRSYITQTNIYNRNVKNNGQAKADTYSARPGSSEHQTGLAFDLNTIDEAFGKSAEGKWVNQNCYKYGFIIRYPEGKTDETGYIYESWHLRYVGTDLSYKLYNNGDWLTMEDYFGITSEYSD